MGGFRQWRMQLLVDSSSSLLWPSFPRNSKIWSSRSCCFCSSILVSYKELGLHAVYFYRAQSPQEALECYIAQASETRAWFCSGYRRPGRRDKICNTRGTSTLRPLCLCFSCAAAFYRSSIIYQIYMAQFQKFKAVSREFLQEVRVEDNYQAFLLGTVCGYYLQKKQHDLIALLQDQMKAILQLISRGLGKRKLFEEFVLLVMENLDEPQPVDFQGGTPVLSDQEDKNKHQMQVEKGPTKRNPSNQDVDEGTLALIQRLQREDEETQRKLKSEQSEPTDCPICYTSLMDDEVYPLEHCVHIFHQECLKSHIMTAIAEKRKSILCPDSSCNTELAIRDIGQIAGTEKQHEYESYTLNMFVDQNAADMSWCPTPDCKYAFVFDDDFMELTCPICKKHYCLNCRVPFHKGQTCKEYQVTNTRDKNDEKFEKFVKGHKFKMCSKCKFWVEKNQGCNHMTCRCGYEFCYVCGGKYMQCECIQKQRAEFERQRQLILQRQQQQRQKKQRGRGKK